MRAEPRGALSTQPAQTRPGHPLPLMARNEKRPAEASSQSQPNWSSPPDETIRAEQSPSFLGERTPRTETSLTARPHL
jgi:hypothetical protein